MNMLCISPFLSSNIKYFNGVYSNKNTEIFIGVFDLFYSLNAMLTCIPLFLRMPVKPSLVNWLTVENIGFAMFNKGFLQ